MSGGSTGHPKLIERTHASWIYSFEHLRSLGGIREGDRVAVLGSLGYSIHAYAAFEALHLGADVLLLSGSRPDRQMLAIEQMGATAVYATPTATPPGGTAKCRGNRSGSQAHHDRRCAMRPNDCGQRGTTISQRRGLRILRIIGNEFHQHGKTDRRDQGTGKTVSGVSKSKSGQCQEQFTKGSKLAASGSAVR